MLSWNIATMDALNTATNANGNRMVGRSVASNDSVAPNTVNRKRNSI
jgi:hypothetical protein